MSSGREAVAGATRTCPHCRTTILDSATVCPGCRHHLRFDPGAAGRASPSMTPLLIEGRISHPPDSAPWEYSVVLSIRNEKGEELTRQVVGVGALQASDERTFTLSVEMFSSASGKTGGRGVNGR